MELSGWQGSGTQIATEGEEKGSFWTREAHRFASSKEENPTPSPPARDAMPRCFFSIHPSAAAAAISSPPPAAAQRDEIKANPAPGDLLLGNNWVLFGRNMEKPGPSDGKSAGEQGLGGMELWRLLGGSVGIKAGFMRRRLSTSNAMDQGKASEQVFYVVSFHSRNCI